MLTSTIIYLGFVSTLSSVDAYAVLNGHASTPKSLSNLNQQVLSKGSAAVDVKPGNGDLLIRALKGEKVERTPVWLMRQAGRYMADFRKYSEKYPFRERSETPEIAIELSLQPWRSFGVDGVIMFSGET